jgi:hypothetical protein
LAKGARLCHRVGAGPSLSKRPGGKGGKFAGIERRPHLAHQIQIEIQVVDGIELGSEDLIRLLEVI